MDMPLAYVRTEEAPKLPAPANLVGLRGWAMQNLFPNFANSVLTILCAYLIYVTLSYVLQWAVFSAVWTSDNRDACAVPGAGACSTALWS